MKPATPMDTSPLKNLHTSAGARLAAPGNYTPVLTYGDVPAEYGSGRQGALLLDLTERGLVRLKGSDAEGFLHRIVANTIHGVAPGQGNKNLLLTGKGKLVHTFDLARLGDDDYQLSTPAQDAARLVQSLDLYLFAEDLALTDASEEHAPLELIGPHARRVIEKALGAAPPVERGHHATISTGDLSVHVTSGPVGSLEAWRLDAGAGGCAALWSLLLAAGATPGGLVAWDSLRAEEHVAAWGRDLSGDVYPQEGRLEDAFSLNKGCYIGQEVVAKIDTYGGLNKRLMLLRVEHDDPVPHGTRLVKVVGDQARDLGVVTTWAYSFALDSGVVLAYVKRKHQADGATFKLVPAETASNATDHYPCAEIVCSPLSDGVDAYSA